MIDPCEKTVTASDNDASSAPVPSSRMQPLIRNRGYVLIFVLWVLTACTVTLLLARQAATMNPKVVEASLDQPIIDRELRSVLNYVIDRLRDQQIATDPKWLKQYGDMQSRMVATGSGTNKAQQAARDLQQILGQLGFKTDIPNLPSTGVASAAGATPGLPGFDLGTQFAAGGGSSPVTVGNREYQVAIEPVTTRPNLNLIEETALFRYLQVLRLTEDEARKLAAEIADWIDPGGFSRPDGAGDTYYMGLRPSYHTRKGPIQDWSELFFLRNGGPDLVAFMRQHFVIHGKTKQVLASALTPEGIAALTDLRLADVERVLASRREVTEGRRTDDLASAVGAANSTRFERAIIWSPPSKDPVLITVAYGRRSLSAVADPVTGKMLSPYPPNEYLPKVLAAALPKASPPLVQDTVNR